jgi:hypothetical protein
VKRKGGGGGGGGGSVLVPGCGGAVAVFRPPGSSGRW